MPRGVKYWDKEKDDKVRYTYFHNLCHAELAAELGLTKSAISSRGYALGLSRPSSEAQKIVCQTDWRKQQLKEVWPKRRKNKMKVKDHLQERRETDDYKFGWESAERGEPKPPHDNADQHLGWSEYHMSEQEPSA